MLSIGIIGRQLNHSKWDALFDILDQGIDAEFWKYTKYSLDNNKSYTGSDDDCLIFLATSPKYEEGKEYIQFTSSADDAQIASVMQDFVDRIMESKASTLVADEIPVTETIVIEDEIAIVEDEVETVIHDPSPLPVIPDNKEDDNLIKKLEGVVIEINGKDVLMHIDDAEKIIALMQFCSEHGYRIKDVVVCN